MSELDQGPWQRFHLFELARSAKRPTHIVAALILSLVFVLVGSAILIVPMILIVPTARDVIDQTLSGPPLTTGGIFALLLIGQFLPIILLVWAWLAVWEKRPFWTLGLERLGALPRYLGGAAIGIGMYGLALGGAALLGYIEPEAGDPAQQGVAAIGGVLLVLLGWVIQGAAEEIVCRGWLLQAAGIRRAWLGVVASSLLFSALHSLNPNIGPVAVINLVLFGVLASLYALYEGGLWGVCGMHAAWNWAQGNLFGIEVSGQEVAGGILWNLRENGPDLITGGAFGSEGGLAVTAVLAIGILVAGWLIYRRQRAAAAKGAEAG
jgi:uncharacterized protein